MKINWMVAMFLLLSYQCGTSQTITFQCESKLFNEQDIEVELLKYPKHVLKQFIPKITVVEDSKENNFCGTADWTEAKINAGCPIFRVAIHHELSSLFLNRYDIYVGKTTFADLNSEFEKLNGNYKYHSMLRTEAYDTIDSNTDLGEHFFARKYSTTNFENDFNVIAENLFTAGSKTIDFMLNNPHKAAAKKIALVVQFYTKLDPDWFTIEFFKKQK